MIKLIKQINDFGEMIDICTESHYIDDIIGDIDDYRRFDNMSVLYHDMLDKVIRYLVRNQPSFINPTYPNCINTTISPFGFSYIKDGIGFGIGTRIDRKSGDVTYTITFYFNKDRNHLKHNSTFNYALENDFNLIETERKPRKK